MDMSVFPERPVADIEAAASALLERYRAQSGRDISGPVPVEQIAEHLLGYEIEISDEGLFADPNYLGGILFDENVIRVNASVETHEGRYSFTIAHEIGHHVLHRELYLSLRDEERPEILCRDTFEKPLIEWQADRFAAALLMPADRVANTVASMAAPTGEMSARALRVLSARVIESGGFSNVSNTAMANRLIDLGHARGVTRMTGTSLDLYRMASANSLSGFLWRLYQRFSRRRRPRR